MPPICAELLLVGKKSNFSGEFRLKLITTKNVLDRKLLYLFKKKKKKTLKEEKSQPRDIVAIWHHPWPNHILDIVIVPSDFTILQKFFRFLDFKNIYNFSSPIISKLIKYILNFILINFFFFFDEVAVGLSYRGCVKWLHHIAEIFRFLDFKNIYNFSSPIISKLIKYILNFVLISFVFLIKK